MLRRTERLLQVLSLSAEVADSEYGLLSTGEKVRALIGRALAIRPRLLILDEPTNGLDLLARAGADDCLRISRRARDMAVVMITHHLEELPPETKQVLVLRAGRAIRREHRPRPVE